MDFLEIFSRKYPVYNFTDILPIEDKLMNANKITEMKQNNFYSDRDKTHKIHVAAEVMYKTELWFMKSLKCRLNIIFCHQPLGAFINIYIFQWHVILPLVTLSSTFRLGTAITSAEDTTEPLLTVRLSPTLFPTFESLLLLRPLMDTIQSVATIKCALGPYVYNVIKHNYRV